ncbi:MAG: phospholipid carrier-dependent glycosyltransferase [Kiritimatiellaeota bacterium]|nr:phospholipid carrier-dependent glycosyltransferase [Kiritimatiellota bacterium]
MLARLATLGVVPLVDPSEGRYALIARDMAESANFVTPMIWRKGRHIVFWGKPPLRFWMGALAFKIFGVNEFAARLPSFLSGLFLLALLSWIINRYRSKNEALTAALFLATSGGFFFLSGVVLQEMTLTAFSSGALLLYYGFLRESNMKTRKWLSLGVFALLGLGFMTKGPLILVTFGLPVFLWHLLNREWGILRNHAWLPGGTLFLLITIPWFWLAERATPGFLRYFFLNENLYRFVKSDYGDLYGVGHKYPFGAAFVFFLALSAPWCVVAFGAVIAKTLKTTGNVKERACALWRSINDTTGDSKSGTDIFLLGFAVNTLFWCFARQIHLYYMIIAVPAFCVWLSSVAASETSLPKHLPKLAWLTLFVYLVSLIVMPGIVDRGKSTKAILAKAKEIMKSDEQWNGKIVFVRKTPYSAYFYGGKFIKIHKKESLEASFKRDIAINNKRDIYIVRPRHVKDIQPELRKHLNVLYSSEGWLILSENAD